MFEIFSVLLWIGLAIGAGAIASSKGRSGVGYFILGFFLPIVGILVAIGVSDNRKSSTLGRQVKPNDLIVCHSCGKPHRADAAICPNCKSGPPDPHAHEKKCPACAEWIKREATKCRFCGEVVADKPAPTPEPRRPYGMGSCPGCGKLRGYDVAKCIYCGDTSVVGAMPPPT